MGGVRYQLWSYVDNGGNAFNDIKSHVKVDEGSDIAEVEKTRGMLERDQKFTPFEEEFATKYYIRRFGEPAYTILNIDYKSVAHIFRTVYSIEECDKITHHLAAGHKKYNTKMITIVNRRDDSVVRGEVIKPVKGFRTRFTALDLSPRYSQ